MDSETGQPVKVQRPTLKSVENGGNFEEAFHRKFLNRFSV